MKLQEVLGYIVIVLAYLLLIISIWKGYNIIGIQALIIFGLGFFTGFMYPPHRMAMYEKQLREQKEQ